MLAAGLLLACNTYPASETLVFLHASPTTAPGADELRVTVLSHEGEVVGEPRVEPVSRGGALLARLVMTPEGSDPTRSFEVLAELLDAGQPALTLRVAGGFVEQERREIHAWFHPECEGQADCGPGRTCARGACVASCFAAELPDAAPDEARPLYGECVRCERNEPVPLPDADPCGCAGDTCRAGRCVAGRRAEAFDMSRGHACLISRDELWCWGQSHARRVPANSDVPRRVEGVNRPAIVAADDSATCVERIVGGPTYVRTCWGWNLDGRLAVGATDSVIDPTDAPPSDPDFRVIEAGLSFFCGLSLDGRLLCWGGDSNSGVGPFTTPTEMHPDADWVGLDVDWQNGCAVHQDGRLLCWGQNASQQLGRSDPLSTDAQLVAGADGVPFDDVTDVGVWNDRTCAVRAGGELWCWGLDFEGSPTPRLPTRVGDWADWEDVDVGSGFVCGLRRGGELWCLGENAAGQLGVGDTARRDEFVRVAVTEDERYAELSLDRASTCALDADGGLRCWGNDLAGVPGAPGVPGLLGLGPLPDAFVTRPRRICF